MEVELLGDRVEVDFSLLREPEPEVRRQLREYEQGARTEFDLSVETPDSFVGRVMEHMRGIPYGETRSYGDVAGALDTAAIALGGACSRNPLPVVVPCHRVVATDGLGGYS
ncbi:MAG: methylated-DNA--[protein]-cysteine S-methyltransferase, partial [Halobacteriales archaeon]